VYDSQWGNGYNAKVYITNLGSSTISGWTLNLTVNNGEQVSSFWRVQSFSQSGNVITAAAGSGHYNGTIGAGQTIDAKYQVSHNGTYALPTNPTLNGQACTQ
jgi:endo-1,4-beta-xylanase